MELKKVTLPHCYIPRLMSWNEVRKHMGANVRGQVTCTSCNKSIDFHELYLLGNLFDYKAKGVYSCTENLAKYSTKTYK